MTCSLGELGGLLFLGLLGGCVLLALACLLLGAIGARWMDDVNRTQALRGINERDDK